MQTNVEECGPCPVFASFTLAFSLQLRKKHEKISVRVRKASVVLKKPQSQYSIRITKNTHTLQSFHKHTHYNWVVTRWQYIFIHKHYIEQHK
jgi:hypothetical protein